jgi:LysR family transcriptional activator of mexEF-oprN operon
MLKSGKLIVMNKTITSPEDEPVSEFDEKALRRIDLNLLVVFAMVVRCGSVQAAAQRLYLGSSGVSMALSRLRSITSDTLFIRGRTGLEPTSFAKSLFQRIDPALTAIAEAMRPQSFDPETATGTVRLALSEDLEIVLAPRLQRALGDRAPHLDLTIRHGDYRRVSKLLDEEVADIVVTARPESIEARHCCEDLLVESFVVLSDAQYLHQGQPMTLDDYLSAPHALVSAKGSVRGRIDEILAKCSLERKVRVVTESFAALPFLLRSSRLVANVPRTAAAALAHSFGLALHELPIESPSFPISMTWRARDECDAAQMWIRNLIRGLLINAEQ